MPIGSIYGVVTDKETGIGIHPCDVILDTGDEEVTVETCVNGGYIVDALPATGYELRFESPDYETKTVSNIAIYAYDFTYVPVKLKKKPLLLEVTLDPVFVKMASPALKARMQFRVDFYMMEKKQQEEEEKTERVARIRQP